MVLDHLYVEAIDPACKQDDLLAALAKLSPDLWEDPSGGRPFVFRLQSWACRPSAASEHPKIRQVVGT
jgi:hypothetical protein